MRFFFIIFVRHFSVLAEREASHETELTDTVFRWFEDGIDSPYLLSFIIDIYEEQLEEGVATKETLNKACNVSSSDS